MSYDSTVPADRRFASLSVSEDEAPDSIALIERIVRVVGPAANEDGDLKIAGLNIQGNLVVAGQTVPGRLGLLGNDVDDEVIAQDIGNIAVKGDIYSDIVIYPATYATTALLGDITKVQSTGRLYGSISTDYDPTDAVIPTGRIDTIDLANGYIGDNTPGAEVFPLIYSTGWTKLIDARTITAIIGVEAGNGGCQCLRRIRSNAGSFKGALSVAGLGDAVQADSGLFVVNGQLDLDVMTLGNVRDDISVTGTIPGGVAFPAGRTVSIGAGLQPTAPLTLNGKLQGQVILNTNNGTQVWSGPTTINGHTITPDANFEFSQKSDDLGGGAIGMAPFRVWASDCDPISKDNDVIGPGDGLFVADLNDANVKPIKVRFYGPIKKGAAYATWNDAFWIECRPLTRKDQDPCVWYPADDGFEIEGPSGTEADVTLARTISIGRAASVYPKPGIYRVIPKMNAAYGIDSVLSRDVDGDPSTVWHRACGTPLALSGDLDPPSDAPAYVFRIIPNCDGINGDTRDDEQQDPPPNCTTECPIADVNQSGVVTVQDIFDFLNYYFAGDHHADVNNSGTVTVQDIFDFLAAYFSCEP